MARNLTSSRRPPSAGFLKRLDKEHSQRANDIWEAQMDDKLVDEAQIISSEAIRSALLKPKLVLPSFDVAQIYSNYIFSSRLFVLTCPRCIKTSEVPTALDVLSHGDLIPVLLGNYVDYPPELIGAIKQSKRYLAYRAAFGFLRTNRTLIGTALVAGTLGLAGSLIGCSATLVAGIAGKLLRKTGRLQPSPETAAFLGGVTKSIRPKVHKLLANYTGISLPAVQLHEIRREIAAKTDAGTVGKRTKVTIN